MHWRNLQLLTLSWPPREEDGWGAQRDMRSSEQDFPLYMSDPFPPVDDWVGPQSVNMIRRSSFLEYNRGRDFSEMLHELEDYLEKNHPGYDADDPNLLTQLWEDHYGSTVAACVAKLAEARPTLQQVDLCFLPSWTNSWQCRNRWTWKISRGRTRGRGSNKIQPHITGEFLWDGGPRTGFRPFEALVGEEMKRSQDRVR